MSGYGHDIEPPAKRTTPSLLRRLARGLLAAGVAAATLTVVPVAPAAAASIDVQIDPSTGDRYLELGERTAWITHCLSEPAYLSMVVHDHEGTEVSTIRRGRFTTSPLCHDGFASTGWALDDDAGVQVPDGEYTIEITAWLDSGETDTEIIRVGVHHLQTAGYLDLPNPDPRVSVTVDGTVDVPGYLLSTFAEIFTPVSAQISCFPRTDLPIGSTTTFAPDDTFVVAVDTRPCRREENTLRCTLRSVDPFGREHEDHCGTESVFVVDPIPDTFEVEFQDHDSSPDEDYRFHFERPLPIHACLTRPGTLTAEVRDSTGNTLRTIASEPITTSRCHRTGRRIEWDLRDAAGEPVPDGTYAVELTATDSSGAETPPAQITRTLQWHVFGGTPGHFTAPAPGAVLMGIEPFEFHVDLDFPFRAGIVIVGCGANITSVPLDSPTLTGTFPASKCPEGEGNIAASSMIMDPLGMLHAHQDRIPVTIFTPHLVPELAQAVEGDTGSTTMDVPVRLSKPAHRDITATWQAVSGTSTAGVDFAATSGTVTFPAGTTTVTVPITVLGDDTPEGDELALVRIESDDLPVDGLWGHGVGVILDDDGTPIVRAGDGTVVEGDAPVTLTMPVTLSSPSATPVTVDWEIIPVTATHNHDLVWHHGSVTFAPGQTEAAIHVEILGDDLVEDDETLLLSLRNPHGATIGGFAGLGFAVIIDDD